MDSYAARLLCAAVMIGTAALSAAMFPSAEVQAEDSRPMIAIAAAQEEQSSTPKQKEFYIALRADSLCADETVQVRDADGRVVQTLCAQDGEMAGPFAPGSYSTFQPRLGSVQFTLHENASMSVQGGNGWTDGEILYLKDGTTCSVDVTVQALTATVPADGLVMTVSLQSETSGEVYQTIVLRKQTGYRTAQMLHFDGLSAGTWQLCRDAAAVQTVELSAESANEITLDVTP